ncbi:MAG: hypothetical protein CVV41_18110 [Candidatus Riflebacteria bacterium HGW-Riflebacteria-1]|jgi:hypothetical protein|nr:MAG: hypothetical protein CVV41_18110 [Candidatus Riflebacteria bacterium HGW-Riflebacteria-1]
MERSETIGKLSEALAKAQGEMKPASFDAQNLHFRNKYATLASIMDACRSALSQNQIAVVQGTSVIEDRVIVTTMLIHASGEFISDQLSMNIIKDSPQAIGSAITYARRYSLASLAGVVSDEDDDAEAAMPKENAQRPVKIVQMTNLDEHKRTRSDNSQKADAAEKTVKPDKPAQKQNKQADQTQIRIQKIRAIFGLSAQLGHTPDDMKAVIGNLIGLDRPIKESAEIKDSDIDRIIDAFSKDLELKEAA